jgi:hypothetical protein
MISMTPSFSSLSSARVTEKSGSPVSRARSFGVSLPSMRVIKNPSIGSSLNFRMSTPAIKRGTFSAIRAIIP